MDNPVRETPMFTDDAKLIADIIQDQWSLGIGNEVVIAYEPESLMIDARIGEIYVYLINRNNKISTTDYRTLERHARVGIRISNRFRNNHFMWCEEVYRILLANRRRGQHHMGGYSYLEILSDRTQNELTGWYSTTIDIELVTYNAPIRSAGFGDEINREIEDMSHHNESDRQ